VTELCASLGVDEDQVIPFSAHGQIGRDDLAEALVQLLDAGPWRDEPVYVPRAEGESDVAAFAESPEFEGEEPFDLDEIE
jgi:hypothetical protein